MLRNSLSIQWSSAGTISGQALTASRRSKPTIVITASRLELGGPIWKLCQRSTKIECHPPPAVHPRETSLWRTPQSTLQNQCGEIFVQMQQWTYVGTPLSTRPRKPQNLEVQGRQCRIVNAAMLYLCRLSLSVNYF